MYVQALSSVGARSDNSRGMLEVENMTHVFSGDVLERRPETRRVVGGGICAEHGTRQMSTLLYNVDTLPKNPVPGTMFQVVREKNSLN